MIKWFFNDRFFVPYREVRANTHFSNRCEITWHGATRRGSREEREKAAKLIKHNSFFSHRAFLLTSISITSFIDPIRISREGTNSRESLSRQQCIVQAVWTNSGRGGLFRFCHWKWLSHPYTLHIDMCRAMGGQLNWVFEKTNWKFNRRETFEFS
jgi:hypothetical protein